MSWHDLARHARPHAGPAMAGLGLGLLALGPALGRGFVLSYDMVFVPDPPITASGLGFTGSAPRAVPSDLVVALVARVIPAEYLQKLILLAVFVLACTGAAALLTTGWLALSADSGPARLTAGICYAWNPFVAERLIMGQWATLLGYAGLPWVLRELVGRARPLRPARLAMTMVPAAVGGFAAIAITSLAVVPVALCAASAWRDRWRRLALASALIALVSLPWLIPALADPVHTDPNGAAAFAARADTPFGAAGSLLMLGGIWNAQAVPTGYGGVASAVWLIVVLLASAGYLLACRPRRICPGLGVAAVAGACIAALGLTGPTLSALHAAIAAWPGFAVLRDGQQFIAPLALAESVGLGAGVGALVRAASPAPARAGPTLGPALALALLALLSPILLLPGLAWGAGGRLHAVSFPADWLRARLIIDSDPRPGSALLLPWAQYRRYRWNDGAAVFDPWPRLLARPTIWNDALQVGSMTVAAENAQARLIGPKITSGQPMTGPLLAIGVRYVIIDAGPLLGRPRSAIAALAKLPGAQIVLASPDLIVLRLPVARRERPAATRVSWEQVRQAANPASSAARLTSAGGGAGWAGRHKRACIRRISSWSGRSPAGRNRWWPSPASTARCGKAATATSCMPLPPGQPGEAGNQLSDRPGRAAET